MFMRQLQYLVAVSREAHFGRAAEACSVSQPTLSAGIRRLEEELGLPLVIRSHRFLGLTVEGERVLAWAQRMVADYNGLRQELSDASDGLAGTLRIGAIPAAVPALPGLVNPFCARYPKVRVQLLSLPSTAIQRGLDELEIDAGITYLDNEPLNRVHGLPLYDERYLFVTTAARFAARGCITWAEAAEHPLCLLTPDMQNRRIVDRILAEAGVAPNPRMEANSFLAVWSQVRSGLWGSIMPHTYLETFETPHGLHAVPLVDPVRSQTVGLVTSDRDLPSPVATAFMRHVTQRPQDATGSCAAELTACA